MTEQACATIQFVWLGLPVLILKLSIGVDIYFVVG